MTNNKEKTDILLNEYDRVSKRFHNYIDNYYKFLPLITSGLLVVYSLKNNLTHMVFGLIPFLLLLLLGVESQLRTTIVCTAQYLKLLEKEINENLKYPALNWESNLTFGNKLYYSININSILKFSIFLPFVILGGLVFFHSSMEFWNYLSLNTKILGMNSNPVKIFYFLVLGLTSFLLMINWIYSFIYPIKIYSKLIEKKMKEIKGVMIDNEQTSKNKNAT